MSTQNTVTIRVAGNKSEIDALALPGILKPLLRLLTSRVTKDWAVAELREGSLVVALEPRTVSVNANSEPDDVRPRDFDAEFNSLVSQLDALDSGRHSSFSKSDLKRIHDAGRQFAGVTDVTLEVRGKTFAIATRLAPNAKRELERKIESLASIEGIIDRISLRGHREFGLLDENNGAVTVVFDASQTDQVKALVGRRVRARGLLTASADRVRMELWTLTECAEPPLPIPIAEVAGSWAALFPDGCDSVALIQEMRRD